MSVSSAPLLPSAPFPYVGLISLAGAIFVSVTSEFLPTGLLPEMSRDLGVSLSTAGYLVSVFAGTVVVATAPLAVLTQRFSRKSLIVFVLVVIAAANLLAAAAPTYGMLVAARVLGGLAHGLFWAVVAAYSAYLVPAHQLGKAVAISAAGASAAFVLGVPVGTAIGNALGWRAAFAIIGVTVLLLTVVVVKFLPAVGRIRRTAGEERVPLRRDPSFLGILVVSAVIVVLVAGQNTFYTYIAPWLTKVSTFDPEFVALFLFLYGGAGILGLALAGYAADRYPRRGFAVAVLVVMAAVSALALAAGNTVIVIVAFIVWGAAFGGIPAMLQTRMMRTASLKTRDLSGAVQTTAFNVGIGGGALMGGLLLDGAGLEYLPAALVILLGVSLALSVISNPPIDGTRPRRARQAARVR